MTPRRARRDRGPYRDGRVHVLNRLCPTCIFRPGNLMRLAPGRVQEMAESAVHRQTAIVCHATLHAPPGQAVCRGFWNRWRRAVWLLRAAVGWGIVTYMPPPPGDGAGGGAGGV